MVLDAHHDTGKSRFRAIDLACFKSFFRQTLKNIAHLDPIISNRGKKVIDIDRLIGFLKPENIIRDDLDLPTLSAAVHVGNLTVSLGHSVKFNAFFKYPKTLPQVIWQGNAQFIGETIALGNEVQVTAYQELALAGAYKIGNLTIGAKGKFLSGIADATSDKNHHSATLYTDPDVYQITLAGDYILNSANSVDYNSYNDLNADFGFGSLTFKHFFSSNSGFALDLGARLEMGKWDFAASVLDLGEITWDEGVTNYAATKSYVYEGLDFSQAVTGGETANFDEALDTLQQLFQVEETHIAYSNALPRKVYLSTLYKMNGTLSFGGLLFYENYRGEPTSALALAANITLGKILAVGGTYAIMDNSYDNLGLNLGLKLGPFQLYAVTDNIIAAFNPGGARNFGARIGGNLVFK